MDEFISIKDLEKGTPSKTQSLVHDGAEGTKRIEFAELLSTALGLTDITEAGFHNSIYRGANLKERFGISDDKALADEVSRRIANGSFEDLYVGDYWPATITTEFGTETVEIVLAGFDIYMGSIYEYRRADDDYDPINRHHAVCVTKKQFAKNHKMHPTTPIPSDGYRATEMYTTTMPKYATAMQTALNGHIIEICDTYAYDIDSSLVSAGAPDLNGATTSWDYDTAYPSLLNPLTEREVYGAPVFSCSAYEAGFETSQLPLFRLNPAAKITGNWYWLKDVAGAGYFCSVGNFGGADCNGAFNTGGVRPRFLIG